MAENVDVQKPPQKGTRKLPKFLGKVGRAAVVGATILSLQGSNPVQQPSNDMTSSSRSELSGSKEKISFPPSVTSIDVAPSVPISGIKQDSFISREEMLKKLTGSVPKEMQGLLMQFEDIYFPHGEKVVGSMRKVWDQDRYEFGDVSVLSLQRILDSSSLSSSIDKDGNERLTVNFNSKRIMELLKSNSNKVINMSFQVGDVGLIKRTTTDVENIGDFNYYESLSKGMQLGADGNVYPGAVRIRLLGKDEQIRVNAQGEKVDPIPEKEYQKQLEKEGKIKIVTSTSLSIEGAYTKENALKNLPELFRVCRAYPDKLFVVAAGNEKEDLRDALSQLKKIRPNNLLIVAQWSKGSYDGKDYELPTEGVQGADIYVNNKDFGVDDGSSFSAPVISAKAAELIEKGYSIEQVRNMISVATERKTYPSSEAVPPQAKVFNPDLLHILMQINKK